MSSGLRTLQSLRRTISQTWQSASTSLSSSSMEGLTSLTALAEVPWPSLGRESTTLGMGPTRSCNRAGGSGWQGHLVCARQPEGQPAAAGDQPARGQPAGWQAAPQPGGSLLSPQPGAGNHGFRLPCFTLGARMDQFGDVYKLAKLTQIFDWYYLYCTG